MNKGFSLIEVAVGVAVLALMAGGLLVSFSGYAARKELASAHARVAALVTEARARTLAGQASSAWGVHFDSDKVALFKAPSYSPSGSDNKTEGMPRRVSISLITFSNNEVVFARLTGAANAGSATLSVVGNPSLSKVTSVNALGTIGEE